MSQRGQLAQNCRIFVDGYSLACAFKELSFKKKTDEVDMTALCTSGDREFQPGNKDAMLSMIGYYDYDETTADRLENILDAAFDARAALIFSGSLGAITPGSPAHMARGGQVKKDVETVQSQAIMTNADLRAQGNIEFGAWLFDGSATSGNSVGTVVDNAVATANGGLLHFHVWLEDDSTATDASILVEGSANGTSGWSTVVATTAIGDDHGAVVVGVAAGTSVPRYLRATFAATGGKAYGVAAFYRAF